MALSAAMVKGLEIAAREGMLDSVPGGFWAAPSTAAQLMESRDPGEVDWVGTRTVQALTSRGLLVRMFADARDYRDPRKLTEAGRRALAELRAKV